MNRYLCAHRLYGFQNCHCARFDDGSCVPPHLYDEFAKRRDEATKKWQASGEDDRSFADRGAYL